MLDGQRTVGLQTNAGVEVEGELLAADERIQTYLKNKETGEVVDYEVGQPIPVGHVVVKRIYKKRSTNVLQRKFKAAVRVAASFGRPQKP